MCAFSNLGAGAAAGCRCCSSIGRDVCVLELACWCRCRVPLQGVFGPVRLEARALAPLEGAAWYPCAVRAAHRNLVAILGLCWQNSSSSSPSFPSASTA